LDYPLLADISKEIARDFGVLVENPDDAMYGAALRGLFILDANHKVRSMSVNDDAVGRSVDEAIRLIQGFQYADEVGEVCPANWKPGAKTIKPDQTAKKQYFEQTYKQEEKKEPKEEPIDTTKFHIKMLQEGHGDYAKQGSMFTVNYTGKLQDGSVFDSTEKRGPFKFTLGRGQVIKCWDTGFAKMKKGAKAVLNCPPDYAYGDRGFPGAIPPKSTLTFEVEVLDF